MDYFYSAQMRQYRVQFIRAFSNFQVDLGTPGSPQLQQVPCRYGDTSRIASTIVNKNSSNTLLTTSFISCTIKSVDMAADRRQDPSFVAKVQVNERQYDEENQRYLETIGNRYTLERYMPVPYQVTFDVDIWSNNTSIKEQLFEQICTIFNPSLEIQTSTNPLDWTVITRIEMTGINWSSRTIPIGTDNPIDVMTLTFLVPIWLNPPAKVKKQKLIEQIITNIISGEKENPEQWDWSDYEFFNRIITTPDYHSIVLNYIGNNQYNLSLTAPGGGTQDIPLQPTITYSQQNPVFTIGTSFEFNGIAINITNTDINAVVAAGKTALAGTVYNMNVFNFNQIQFVNNSGGNNVFSDISGNPVESMGLVTSPYIGGTYSWARLFEAYGEVRPYAQFSTNASQLHLRPSIIDASNDIIGYIDLYPTNQNLLTWTVDPTSLPSTTLANIASVVDPTKNGPGSGLPSATTGQRYLLINEPPEVSNSWGNLASSRLGDIIQFDGVQWHSVFIAANELDTVQYVTNIFNGKLLVWENGEWSDYIGKIYSAGQWRISL